MRPAIAALAAALVAAPLSTGARAVDCPLLLDARGDARILGLLPAGETRVDIVSGDIASGQTSVVAVLRLATLAPDVLTTVLSADWSFAWDINGTTYAGTAHQPALSSVIVGSFRAGATAVPVAFQVDPANATLTWVVPRSAFPDLDTPHQTFGAIRATTAVFSSTADVVVSKQTYEDRRKGCIDAP